MIHIFWHLGEEHSLLEVEVHGEQALDANIATSANCVTSR